YARQFSDLGNRKKGGVVDYFSRGTYGKAFESIAFSLKKGEISPVFTTRHGAFIVKCLDSKTTETLSLDKVSTNIRRMLFNKKFQEKVLGELGELKSKANIEITTPAARVLLKVNEFELTSSVLFAVYPELRTQANNSPESFRESLNSIAEKELVYQYMVKHYFSKPTQQARNFKIYKAVHYFNVLSLEEAKAKIKVTEDEIKKFYEEKKEFYHGTSPRKLGVLVFTLPRREKVSENLYFVEYNKMRDRAESFLHLVKKEKKDFVATAKVLATQDKKITYYETDYITEFPEDWRLSISILEFSTGRISPLFISEKGLTVFKVLDTQKPRILSLEEVQDKIYRVLFSNKKRDYFNSLKEKTLKVHNYRLLF
ncbi:peptidyl-prolyl cis-trans isomerase, partial [Candidatus Sumerlaeota bacterium]|nr:peptidyl-prolyl cis-trans isomerase [Candidatus Sumerlaeota bacterium]